MGGPKAKIRGDGGPKVFWLQDLPRDLIHDDSPMAFPYNVIISASRTRKEGFLSANGLPREYHGQYV